MTATATMGAAGVLGASGLALCWLALVVARRPDRPGRTAFGLFAGVVAVAALSGAVGLLVGVEPTIDGWNHLVRAPAYLAVGAWFVFVVQYTGRSESLTGRGTIALMSPLVAAVVLTTLDVGIAGQNGSPADIVSVLDTAGGTLWIAVGVLLFGLFPFAFAFAGIAILLQTSFASDRFSAGLAGTLGVVVVSPLVASFVGSTVNDAIGTGGLLAIYAIGFGSCAVACWVAIDRYEAFGSSAVAVSTLARRRVLSELEDAIVVLDDRNRIVDLNDAAMRTFDVRSQDVIGDPVDALVGQRLESLDTDDVVRLETVDGTRRFDSQATGLVVDDQWVGTVVNFRDVTERELREQRIRILNRVLRHNLRNKLAVVRGNAERVRTVDEPSSIATEIQAVSDELLALGEKARMIESVLDAQRSNVDPTRVAAVVESVVEDVRARNEDYEIDVAIRESWTIEASGRALEYVVGELIENAIAHNDAASPRVEVTVTADDERHGIVSIVDNGPGIPEEERVAIQSGEESPLVHGSGLGLWGVRWIVTLLGGDLQFAANDPRGTIVHVDLPRQSTPESLQDPTIVRDRSEAGLVTTDGGDREPPSMGRGE
ncbi:sensor histidine kinase [Halopiger goleimassiliensis]|uniref:sensor histidine kinase n=1 Tax=Halopiger goleimassiliensis TaxID=1293048 RepID=UPI0006780618|nr:sensor histidine kinase [Halopiger goleimassiliensis]